MVKPLLLSVVLALSLASCVESLVPAPEVPGRIWGAVDDRAGAFELAEAYDEGAPSWLQERDWTCTTDAECVEECLANLPHPDLEDDCFY